MNFGQLVLACYRFWENSCAINTTIDIDGEQVKPAELFCRVDPSGRFLGIQPTKLPGDPNIKALVLTHGTRPRIEFETSALDWKRLQGMFQSGAPECRDIQMKGRCFLHKDVPAFRTKTQREFVYRMNGKITRTSSARTVFISQDPLCEIRAVAAQNVADFIYGFSIWDESAVVNLPQDDPEPTTEMRMEQKQKMSQELRQVQEQILRQEQRPLAIMCMSQHMRQIAHLAFNGRILRANHDQLASVVREIASDNPLIKID